MYIFIASLKAWYQVWGESKLNLVSFWKSHQSESNIPFTLRCSLAWVMASSCCCSVTTNLCKLLSTSCHFNPSFLCIGRKSESKQPHRAYVANENPVLLTTTGSRYLFQGYWLSLFSTRSSMNMWFSCRKTIFLYVRNIHSGQGHGIPSHLAELTDKHSLTWGHRTFHFEVLCQRRNLLKENRMGMGIAFFHSCCWASSRETSIHINVSSIMQLVWA